MLGSSWVAAQLVASQERLSSVSEWQPVEWSQSVNGISEELVGELAGGLLGLGHCELLLLEAGSWGQGQFRNSQNRNVRHCKPLLSNRYTLVCVCVWTVKSSHSNAEWQFNSWWSKRKLYSQADNCFCYKPHLETILQSHSLNTQRMYQFSDF
jgi:hypothetical protein